MIEILRVAGAFGVGGAVRVFSFSRNLSIYKKIYNKDKEEFSFRVLKFLNKGKSVIIIENINTRDSAETLRGEFFYVKKIDLPQTGKNEFYPHDLIDRKVHVICSNATCRITDVKNFGAGNLIEVLHKNDKFLIPFTEENFPASGDEIFLTLDAFNGFKN
ncbi:MAG: ribosome maturation factor RimM [Holosporaceae bacterium]|jgi:16S rRNA processing protein RimM|nr:ribosome maturation factor RimM [Holosporaceae bacterium]